MYQRLAASTECCGSCLPSSSLPSGRSQLVGPVPYRLLVGPGPSVLDSNVSSTFWNVWSTSGSTRVAINFQWASGHLGLLALCFQLVSGHPKLSGNELVDSLTRSSDHLHRSTLPVVPIHCKVKTNPLFRLETKPLLTNLSFVRFPPPQ